MARFRFALAAVIALAANSASAFTIGSPSGLAAGTTGGAGGKTVYPTSNSELVNYLASNDPLVIVLNKTFDFRGTEGTTTETGCRPDYTRECMAKKNGYKSQDVIIQGGSMANTGGCTGGTAVKLTYDNAARKRMTVTGNKTIRGIGKSGVIKGKGMMLDGDNIILQNIHITELNPHVIGGNPNERVVVHVANNYWGNNTGHSFEIGANGYVIAEGNYFDNTKQPLYKGTDGALYAATNSDECSKYLGRSCAANTLVGSGTFEARNGGSALKTIKGVSAFVNYKPDITKTTSGSKQQQQSSQSNGSQQQQQQPSQTSGSAKEESFVTSGSEQQQEQQQEQQWGGSLPYHGGSDPKSGSKSRKLAVQTRDLEKEWQQTAGNFGVGKLD
ncbi:Pectin lyase fold [Phytophthora cactorum]|nr:Pectin lyase fold [Phytophthora cactorum]